MIYRPPYTWLVCDGLIRTQATEGLFSRLRGILFSVLGTGYRVREFKPGRVDVLVKAIQSVAFLTSEGTWRPWSQVVRFTECERSQRVWNISWQNPPFSFVISSRFTTRWFCRYDCQRALWWTNWGFLKLTSPSMVLHAINHLRDE
jgi:hypothetical protein